MAFRGRKSTGAYSLPRRPDDADREFVKKLSEAGWRVRDLCKALGERFGLDRPMARYTLYYHFRDCITRRLRGRRAKPVRARDTARDSDQIREMMEHARRVHRAAIAKAKDDGKA